MPWRMQPLLLVALARLLRRSVSAAAAHVSCRTRQPSHSQPHCCRIIAILENALAKLSVLEKITPDEPEEGQQVHGAYNVYHLRPHLAHALL